uniref:DEP domain-containing protein n=1 Tax=Accipiter nisus TaxID=211598 RepID=A0A8B9MI14_9AVES
NSGVTWSQLRHGDSESQMLKCVQVCNFTICSCIPGEEEGVKYERTFVASEFIDWLIQEGEATTRTEAEQLGRRLLEHGIIQHGEKFTAR